jgi:hypothetical protein
MADRSTYISADQEADFQNWYKDLATLLGINSDPDDPQHFYDNRAAYLAKANPLADIDHHWPSQFKYSGHPREILFDPETKMLHNTKTGEMGYLMNGRFSPISPRR